MRISDWSSDVCSSDLVRRMARQPRARALGHGAEPFVGRHSGFGEAERRLVKGGVDALSLSRGAAVGDRHRRAEGAVEPGDVVGERDGRAARRPVRSAEPTSELQSLMRISYAVFCLKQKNTL